MSGIAFVVAGLALEYRDLEHPDSGCLPNGCSWGEL